MPQQCQFVDPRTGHTYTFQVNPPYDGIQPATKQRTIDRTSNTGNVGATKQQGDDGPYVLNWTINVFHASQEQQMWTWFVLCKTQTIYLIDWNGNEFEGQIIELGDQWKGAIAGPGDTRDRIGYTTMTMQFEVWRMISGIMAAAGVTP